MDEILRTSPKEFQKISKRVIHRFNPERDYIRNARDLEKRILKGMRETGNYRALGYVKGKGPQLAVQLAAAGEKVYQRLLGWIRPKVRKIRPVVKRWYIVGYRWLIGEAEQEIIWYRQKLRELGVRLRPFTGARIRFAEKRYMKRVARTTSKKKSYWWKRR